MADTIKAEGGNILVRPAGGVLATDCASQHCSPCITTDQDDANLAIAGACLGNPFWQSGLIQMHPDGLFWCEAWEGPTWAGDCCWIWANYVDISEWTAPGWVFNWVLIVCYNSATDTYNANIYVGSDFDNGDPCVWMVGDTPAFTAADVDVTCGPDGKLHGTFEKKTSPATSAPAKSSAAEILTSASPTQHQAAPANPPQYSTPPPPPNPNAVSKSAKPANTAATTASNATSTPAAASVSSAAIPQANALLINGRHPHQRRPTVVARFAQRLCLCEGTPKDTAIGESTPRP